MSESPSLQQPEIAGPQQGSLGSRPPSRLPKHLPWLLFVCALALRLIGIAWGLPNEQRYHSYHPDEPINFAYAQQIEPAKGDFDPGFYNYGTLYLTLLRVAGDVSSAYGEKPREDDPSGQWRVAGRGILAGRILSAIAGAGTVLAVFLLLRRYAGPFAASLGALMVAFAPAHVVHSRFATPDVLATFLVVLSAACALRFLRAPGEDKLSGPLRAAILAGLFAGLAAGTKYTGGLALLTLFTALLISRPLGCARFALGGTLAAIGGFLVSTPGVLTNWQAFSRDFTYELRHSASGHGLLFECRNSAFVVQAFHLAVGIGILLVALSVVGILATPKHARGALFALLAFALPYYLLIGRSEVMFLRYTFPLYLVLAFGFGMLIVSGARGLRGGVLFTVLGILGLGGIDGAGLQSAAQLTLDMAGEDPRDATVRYLKGRQRISPGDNVGLVSDPWYYTPPLFPHANAPRPLFIQSFAEMWNEWRAVGIERFVPENPRERHDWDIRLLEEMKPEYVVFSSFESDELARLVRCIRPRADVKLQVDRFQAFLKKLQADYQLDKRFGTRTLGVHDLDYVRPTLWVWKRKSAL